MTEKVTQEAGNLNLGGGGKQSDLVEEWYMKAGRQVRWSPGETNF